MLGHDLVLGAAGEYSNGVDIQRRPFGIGSDNYKIWIERRFHTKLDDTG